jgi:hypothetical protein
VREQKLVSDIFRQAKEAPPLTRIVGGDDTDPRSSLPAGSIRATDDELAAGLPVDDAQTADLGWDDDDLPALGRLG